MEHSQLYNLPLHQTIMLMPNTFVMRVPGGWIYSFSDKDGTSSVFVPYNKEFQKPE